MKHLFILNPTAGRIGGRLDAIENDIRSFFAGNPGLDYAIHVTRWKRDASGYTLRYVNDTPEIVRVYAFGGNGTFFEVINGAIGLPNVQIAWYPLGRNNSLLHSFGVEHLSAFQSLRNLSLSPVSTIDTIRAGNNYMAINALIGGEAEAFSWGESLADHFALSRNACYIAAGIVNALLHRQSRHYYLETEDTQFHGDFRSILVTNTPTYGAGLRPAADALMNDGYMDLYTIKRVPRSRLVTVIGDYTRGNYRKWPEYISHYRCKKLRIFSDSIMTIAIDGEFFYRTSLDFEVLPGSLDFVCPPGVSIPVQKDLSGSAETIPEVSEWA
jgi:diacylglycerol kinase family enzyme